jgi:tetratricopeptide (TPR) repeat protein
MGGEVTGDAQVTHQTGSPGASPALALWLPVVVVAATAVTFGRALTFDFVAWDDDVNFLMNPYYRGFTAENVRWMFTSFHVGHYMPLTWLSAALDYELWGMDPRGYHLTNVVLHTLCALLFMRVVLRLLPEWPPDMRLAGAATGALFFALHPLRVESVAWVTERRDVLSGVFLMLTVLAWLRSRQAPAANGRRGWYVLSVAAFACSLLSKVSGMTLPVALLVLDVFPLRRGPRLLEKLPLFALALGGAVLGYLGQRESTDLLATLDSAPLSQRLAVSAYALGFYAQKTLLPTWLGPLYEIEPDFDPLDARYVLSAAAVLAVTAAAWALRRRRAGAAFLAAWVCYVVLAAPTMGLLQVGRQLAADRYSYVACLPFAVLFGAAVRGFGRGWATGPRIASAVLVVLGALTHLQLAAWADTEALFRRALAVDPDSYVAHRKLGIELHEQQRYAEAIEHFERCLALRPDGGNAGAWTGLALATMARGEPGDLTRTFEALDAALAGEPRNPLAWDVLENLLLRANRAADLEARCTAALEADAQNDRALLTLARLRAAQGDPNAAVELGRRVLALDPEHFEALKLCGAQSVYLGRWSEARAVLERARALRPRDPGVLTNLGLVAGRQGHTEEAEALWRLALRYDPSYTPARRYLDSPESR